MNQSQAITEHLLKEFKKGTPVPVVLDATKAALKKYKLESLYMNIVHTIQKQLLVERELKTLYIDTPYRVDEKTLQQIHSYITSEEVPVLIQRIQPELLAGFKATYDGHVYDASARKHINNIYNLK